ncbi:Beta-D-xylosidase 4 [Hibiscus syriacus]|uniref:Beta-D-xylosidase 4 n=1 Tax=Hibiscus syriacus TaxID=106335 RepID=A0A6A2ZP73_HIBSY|nr:Beta-D-xylosidase 4 [Hibiscus syriacus]
MIAKVIFVVGFLISLQYFPSIPVWVLAQPVFACDAMKDLKVMHYGFCNVSSGRDVRVADSGYHGGIHGSSCNVQRWISRANILVTKRQYISRPTVGKRPRDTGRGPLAEQQIESGYVRGLQRADGYADPSRLKVAACYKHYTAYDLDNLKGIDRYHFDVVVISKVRSSHLHFGFVGGSVYLFDIIHRINMNSIRSDLCTSLWLGNTTRYGPYVSTVIQELCRRRECGECYVFLQSVSDCDSVEVFFKDQYYTKREEAAVAEAISAGLDINRGSFLGHHTAATMKAGLLKESSIDKAVSNNFDTLMRLGFFDGYPRKQPYGKLGPKDVCTPKHQELALEAVRQGIMLLKNRAGSLPLFPTAIKTLAVIGPNANVTKTMIGNYEENKGDSHAPPPPSGSARLGSARGRGRGRGNTCLRHVRADTIFLEKILEEFLFERNKWKNVKDFN